MNKLIRFILNPYAIWCKVKDLTHSHLHPPASRCMFAEHTLDANADETIKRYIEHQEHRKADLVVYTCITNDYDNIHEISAHRYVNLDADYVCFSDNDTLVKQRRVGIWQIRPLQFRELDSTRNNRWHKFMPHMLFPEYKRSIYIDANIDILTPWLFEEFEKRQIPFMLPRHGWRDCVYNEYDTVISLFLDDLNRVKDELKLIRKAKCRKNLGIPRTTSSVETTTISKLSKLWTNGGIWSLHILGEISYRYAIFSGNTDSSYPK